MTKVNSDHPASHSSFEGVTELSERIEPGNERTDEDETPKSDEALLPEHTSQMDVIETEVVLGHLWSRSQYGGALLFNLATFLLPAVYGTLSKMWIAGIDSSLVSTADSYTYASIIVEVINEGLPRGLWSLTTNRTSQPLNQRLQQVLTLITIQSILGTILTIVFISTAPAFVSAFVPGDVRAVSVEYIRISSGSLLASTVETAVSIGTRTLDHPDVPLAISSVKTIVQIFLELALVSKVHVKGFDPTVKTQAIIRLVCDLLGAAVGVAYFVWILRKAVHGMLQRRSSWISLSTFRQLFRPGKWTLMESAIRNAINLYLVHSVVSMGNTYATAWGVFNTIRWGLVMVPVQSLEATSNVFVGHRWGAWLSQSGGLTRRATWKEIKFIVTPALGSLVIALMFEVPICIALSFAGADRFAYYLSGSEEVASVTAMMWRSVDWMYICYAMSTCLATILLATRPALYLAQSLVSNLAYVLPWAIVISQHSINPDSAWWWHQWVFGGSLVFSFVDILAFDGVWGWLLKTGRMERSLRRRQKA